MSELWMDVDVALSEVSINLLALVDDTDFKTREESVVFNQSGLDLLWNFMTTAGAFTQTAVTPTDTAGDYDWVNQGNAMYTIEMPASGGASINNDTEGFGWFTGFATGVLPWRGPIIGFRAAALNNALIDGGDVLDVSLTEIGGVAQSATDLKDFADDGYNPATNKVTGVLLVDTTTTNTDMVGTDNALLASAAPTNFGDLSISVTTGLVDVTQTAADKAWSTAARILTAATNITSTGGTTFTQTGDSFNLIGTAGAGLTNINLPNQTMNITGTLSGSVGSVTGAVGSVTGSIGSLGATAKSDVNTEVDNALAVTTYAEPSAVPGATATIKDMIHWNYTLSRNKGTQTSTTKTLRNDADSADIATSTISSDGTTFTRNEYV